MAKYDLEKLYRSITARVRRSPANSRQLELASVAAKYARAFREEPNEENLILFKAAEIKWSSESSTQRFFWKDFEDALETRDFCITRNVIKTAHSGLGPPEGYIYLAISTSKPGQIKIGSTKNELNIRFAAFKAKYHYVHFEAIYSKWVKFPDKVEQIVTEKLKKYRVNGNVKGDSIEWYKLNAPYCKRVVTESIKNMSFSTQD